MFDRRTPRHRPPKLVSYVVREVPMTSLFPLADMKAIPAIGSKERDAHERAATARGRELVIECDGKLREALYALEWEIRGKEVHRAFNEAYGAAREYSRALVDHVEQCWASAVVR